MVFGHEEDFYSRALIHIISSIFPHQPAVETEIGAKRATDDEFERTHRVGPPRCPFVSLRPFPDARRASSNESGAWIDGQSASAAAEDQEPNAAIQTEGIFFVRASLDKES